MLGGEFGNGLPVLFDGEPSLAGQAPVTVEDDDLVFPQQIGHTVGELLGDGARARDNFAGIEADVFGGKPKLVETMEQMVDLRAAQ